MGCNALGCCVFFFVPLTNICLIASCSVLLSEARVLQAIQDQRHGSEWPNKLVTWSIVGICVGAIQSVFLFSWFFVVRNLPDASTKLRRCRILFCIVQPILILLTLLVVLIPGIDQWPNSYQETDWVMYSAIWFIVIYVVGQIVVARAVLIKPSLHPTNAT